jgi:hypothetical protein
MFQHIEHMPLNNTLQVMSSPLRAPAAPERSRWTQLILSNIADAFHVY